MTAARLLANVPHCGPYAPTGATKQEVLLRFNLGGIFPAIRKGAVEVENRHFATASQGIRLPRRSDRPARNPRSAALAIGEGRAARNCCWGARPGKRALVVNEVLQAHCFAGSWGKRDLSDVAAMRTHNGPLAALVAGSSGAHRNPKRKWRAQGWGPRRLPRSDDSVSLPQSGLHSHEVLIGRVLQGKWECVFETSRAAWPWSGPRRAGPKLVLVWL